jgi:hypothetical protein
MSGFTIPNTPDAFNQNQAEPDSLDFQILGSADTGVVSGMDVIPGSSVTVDVLAGEVLIKGVYYRLASNKLSLALTSAGTDGFFDIVYARINGANTVDVYVTGTATGPNPRFPATGNGVGQINTDTDVVLASVWRTANIAPTSQHITDKRIFVRSNGNRVANTTPTNGTAIGSGSSGDTYVNTAWVTNATNLSSPLSVKVGNTWYNLAKYSENFTAGTITANLVGNVTGNVSGTAGGVAWTNVSGKPAIGDVFNNGGTYSINITGGAEVSRYLQEGGAQFGLNSLNSWGTATSGMHSAGRFDLSGNFYYLISQPGNPSSSTKALVINNDGRVAFNTLSSLRDHKENISDIEDGLEIVKNLRPRTFIFSEEHTDMDSPYEVFARREQLQYGFVVEEVQEVSPDFIHHEETKHGHKPQMWKHHAVIAVLTKAVQELSAKVEALEAQ